MYTDYFTSKKDNGDFSYPQSPVPVLCEIFSTGSQDVAKTTRESKGKKCVHVSRAGIF